MSDLIDDFKRWQVIRDKVHRMSIQSPNNEELKNGLANADKELTRLYVEISKQSNDEAILETHTH